MSRVFENGSTFDTVSNPGGLKIGENLERTVAALRAGYPVIFPTDTVYGIGVSVDAAESPEAIYQAKERDLSKPVAWLVDSIEALDVYGDAVPAAAHALAHAQWPGPLTLVVKASERVPAAFTSTASTIGLRMPNHTIARELIRRLGCPIATSSANISAHPSTAYAQEIDPVLSDKVAAVLVDDSQGASGISSMVIDCTSSPLRILREGSISAADVRAILT